MKQFVVLMCLCVSTLMQAQHNVKTFDEFFTPNMQKKEGVFPIYIAENEIYLEIPHQYIGREIAIAAQIDRGFDLINRPVDKALGVVHIALPDDETIYFQQPFYTERLLDKEHQFQRAFSLSNVQPKGEAYPVVTYSKEKGAIIEITNYILNGNNWFSYEHQFIRSLNRSLSEVVSTHSQDQSVSITVRRYHGAEGDRYMFSSSNVLSPAGDMPLEVTCTISLLPNKKDKLRLADYRVPYQNLSFKDYTQDPYNIVEDSLILRWDLSQPLIFYVDTLFPKEYFQAVKEGVLQWNKAFSKAGIRNPLQVKYADKKIEPALQRALISYDLKKPGVKGSITYHPRSGEILSCRINIGHGFLNEEMSDYLLTCGASDKRIKKNRHSEEVKKELLQNKVTQETARVLGLNKSLSEKQCGEALQLSNADYQAIYFGYKPLKGNNNCYKEREVLRKWIDNLPAESLLHANNGKPMWQTTSQTDYASKITNLQTVVSQLDDFVYQEEDRDSGRPLSNLYRKAIGLYGSYFQDIAKQVGSNQPAAQQHKAMSYLNKYLFNCNNAMENAYIKKNLLANRNSLLYPELKKVFSQLFSAETIKALQLQGLQVDNNYSETQFFQDLYSGLFNGFEPSVEVSSNQMDYQLLCLDAWLDSIEANDKKSDAVRLLVNQLQELSKRLDDLSTTHPQPEVRKIYKLLIRRINDSTK